MDGMTGRTSAKNRLIEMVKRLRDRADGLEKLSKEVEHLSPDAEQSLWQLTCGRFE